MLDDIFRYIFRLDWSDRAKIVVPNGNDNLLVLKKETDYTEAEMSRDCVFCKIIAGELPSYKVYEDDTYLGFLDIHPLNRGHSLLIPKKHVRWPHLVIPFGEYWEKALLVTKAIIKALGADHVNYVTLGYAVPHSHIHIIPRYTGDDLGEFVDWAKDKKFTTEEFQKAAKTIRDNS